MAGRTESTDRRRAKTRAARAAGVVGSALFASVIVAGAPAQAATYCSPGANETPCAFKSQGAAGGKVQVAQALVNTSGIPQYDSPDWFKGWSACQATSHATRSIRWRLAGLYRPDRVAIIWDCYATP